MRVTTVPAVLFVVIGLGNAKSCAQDDCFRGKAPTIIEASTDTIANHHLAVEASAFTTRRGVASCSSYLHTTVTPATVIFTQTATVLQSNSVVVEVTATTTLGQTVTSTADATATAETTITTTVFELPAASAVRRRDGRVNIAERQVTEVPSKTPTYATGCSGSVCYSSACSCNGVTARTIIAAAPSITVIVTATVLTTFTTQTTTAVTVTALTTISTAYVTNTATTISPVATVVCPAPAPAFILQAVGGGTTKGQFAKYSGSSLPTIPATMQAQASKFTLDAQG